MRSRLCWLGRVSGLFCGLVLVAPLSASAVKPRAAGAQGFAFTVTTLVGTSGPVEQQPSVVNPGPCLWTIDSRETWQAVPATLDAGASSSAAACLIADDAWHVASVIVHAPAPDLVVVISYGTPAETFQVAPQPAAAGGYEYEGCVYGPTYSTVSALPEVPGSNGGHGIVTQVTVTVSNPTGRAVRKMDAEAEVASHGFCRLPVTEAFVLDGAIWETGL